MPDPLDEKTQLRPSLIHRRSQIRNDQITQHSKTIQCRLMALPEIQTCKSIFCFVSLAEEVETHSLIDSMLQEGKLLTIPKIIHSKQMIAIPFKNWSELTPGQLGILTPMSSVPYKGEIDVCITPGIGFTANGTRLGYGQGYYDKWLAKHTVKYKIAVAFECQLVDNLPTDANDVAMDMIVTEERIIRVHSESTNA